MTYTPTQPMRREGWTDEQRSELARLEGNARPSPFARGSLRALTLTANNETDRARCAALARKWEGEP